MVGSKKCDEVGIRDSSHMLPLAAINKFSDKLKMIQCSNKIASALLPREGYHAKVVLP